MSLTFDESIHTYRWNGNKVPSVTELIGQFVKSNIYGAEYYVDVFTGNAIATEVFDQAADHGTAVHKAVKYELEGGVNKEALPWDVLASLNQYLAWEEEHVKETISVEEAAYSEKYGYAGTWDIVCVLKAKYGGRRAIVDIKTGLHTYSGPQTAGYEQLYRENSKYRGKMDRFVLKLPKDGSGPKFIQEKNSFYHDFSFIKSRLHDYNFVGGM